jgi:hypothetical protein
VPLIVSKGWVGKRFVWRIKSDINETEDLERQLLHAIRQKQVLEELCQGLRREEIDFEIEIKSAL